MYNMLIPRLIPPALLLAVMFSIQFVFRLPPSSVLCLDLNRQTDMYTHTHTHLLSAKPLYIGTAHSPGDILIGSQHHR